jgi:hypothetical protein
LPPVSLKDSHPLCSSVSRYRYCFISKDCCCGSSSILNLFFGVSLRRDLRLPTPTYSNLSPHYFSAIRGVEASSCSARNCPGRHRFRGILAFQLWVTFSLLLSDKRLPISALMFSTSDTAHQKSTGPIRVPVCLWQ